jgi:hypothetical protein
MKELSLGNNLKFLEEFVQKCVSIDDAMFPELSGPAALLALPLEVILELERKWAINRIQIMNVEGNSP